MTRRFVSLIFILSLVACGGGGGGDTPAGSDERLLGVLIFGELIRGEPSDVDVEVRMEAGPESSRIPLVEVLRGQEKVEGPRLAVGRDDLLVDEAARFLTNGANDRFRFYVPEWDGRQLADNASDRERNRLIRFVGAEDAVDLAGFEITAMQAEAYVERADENLVLIAGIVRVYGTPDSGAWGEPPAELPLAVGTVNWLNLDADLALPLPVYLANGYVGYPGVQLGLVTTGAAGLQPIVRTDASELSTALARVTDGVFDEVLWPFGLQLLSFAEVHVDASGDGASPVPPFFLVPLNGPDLVGYTLTGARLFSEHTDVGLNFFGDEELHVRGAVVLYGRPE